MSLAEKSRYCVSPVVILTLGVVAWLRGWAYSLLNSPLSATRTNVISDSCHSRVHPLPPTPLGTPDLKALIDRGKHAHFFGHRAALLIDRSHQERPGPRLPHQRFAG